MKKDPSLRNWTAAVMIEDLSNKLTHGSFLVVQARNRFLALKEIAATLPDNPRLLDQGGHLLPYEVVCLEQCCTCCVSDRLIEYAAVFDSATRKKSSVTLRNSFPE